MEKSEINKLFSNLCCSSCGTDFGEQSFNILREDDLFCVVQVECSECGKSFGMAFLGNEAPGNKKESYSDEELALEIQEGPPPITSNDVIDAHNFIKNLDKDWQKHIPEDFKMS